MSPFTTHQPGGRRARVNERLFFIKRSLIERNNSRMAGGGEPAPYPVVAGPGGSPVPWWRHWGPLAALLRPPFSLKMAHTHLGQRAGLVLGRGWQCR